MVSSVESCGPFGNTCTTRASFALNNLNRLPSDPAREYGNSARYPTMSYWQRQAFKR